MEDFDDVEVSMSCAPIVAMDTDESDVPGNLHKRMREEPSFQDVSFLSDDPTVPTTTLTSVRSEVATSAQQLPRHFRALDLVFRVVDAVLSTLPPRSLVPFEKLRDGAMAIVTASTSAARTVAAKSLVLDDLLRVREVWPEAFVVQRDDPRHSSRVFVSSTCSYREPSARRQRAAEFRTRLARRVESARGEFLGRGGNTEKWDLESVPEIVVTKDVSPMVAVQKAGLSKEVAVKPTEAGASAKCEKTGAATTVTGKGETIKGVPEDVVRRIESLREQRVEATAVHTKCKRADVLKRMPQLMIALRQSYRSERRTRAPLSEASVRLSAFVVPKITKEDAAARILFLSKVVPEIVRVIPAPPMAPSARTPSPTPPNEDASDDVWIDWGSDLKSTQCQDAMKRLADGKFDNALLDELC